MTSTTDSPRPNFLWISLEDCSPRLGCYGDPAADTPTLDRLAAEGCLYRNAFCTAPVCAPSRVSIITGHYANSIGAHHMRTATSSQQTDGMPTPYKAVPPHDVKCFTEYLRAGGYYCTNNGKTDYNFDAPTTAWDENWDAFPKNYDGTVGPAHWRNRKAGQPFFAVFNLNRSHETCMWDPDRWHDQPDDTPVTDPDKIVVPPYLPDTPVTRKALARHYDAIAENDRVAAKILALLEEDGLAENTIVFIWSDHGSGLPRSKREVYDSGIRIPLIVRWPGQIAPGTVSDQLVSLIDLGPTVLGLAGLSGPPRLQGQPFLGPEARERDFVFASKDRMDVQYHYVRAARSKRYKYIRNHDANHDLFGWGTFQNRHPVMRELWERAARETLTPAEAALFAPHPPEELYDLENDPWEMQNLAGDSGMRAILESHRRAMDEWQTAIEDLGRLSENELVRRFFPDGHQPETTPPHIIPVGPYYEGRSPIHEDQVLQGPCKLIMVSTTQGASIAWRLDEDPPNQWRLYTTPITAKPGQRLKIRAKAVRYGYKESKATRVRLQITE